MVGLGTFSLGAHLDIRLEKRLAPRRNTMIVATIVFDAGKTQIDCIIRNLSESGAKIEVASVKGIPPSFDLMVPGHRKQHCRVAWRAMREMGIAFAQPFN